MIYVADGANNRTIGYPKASLASGMSVTVVYGQPNLTTGTAGTTRSVQRNVTGVRFDTSSGRLFINDADNNRVLAYYIDNAPSASSSLAQYQSDGTTSISVGGSTNSSTAVFKATVSDTDASDTDSLCVEIQTTATAFTNYETACGSAVAEGGPASVTVSTLSSGVNYHWQARTRDSYGAYSAWTSFGGNSDTITAATDIYYAAGIPADYVYGQGGSYTTSGTSTASTGMNTPGYTAVDTANHRLFVVEYGNNRVLVFNLDSSNNPTDATADNVLGQAGFGTSTAATSQAGMSQPYSLAFDSVNNRLYVGEVANKRVLCSTHRRSRMA